MHTVRYKGLLKALEQERSAVAARLDELDSMIHHVKRWSVMSPQASGLQPKVKAAKRKPDELIRNRPAKRYQITCDSPGDLCPRAGKPFMSAVPRAKSGKNASRYCTTNCGHRHRRWKASRESGVSYHPRPVTLLKGDSLRP